MRKLITDIICDPEFIIELQDGYARLADMIGQGANDTEALANLRVIVHKRFQSLRHIPPGKLSESENRNWYNLNKVIDVEQYSRWNPIEEPVIGKVLKANNTRLTLELFTEPEEVIVVNIDDLPPTAVEFGKGDHFGARIRRFESGIVWTHWEHREPLADDESVWNFFDREARNETTGKADEIPET